MLASHHILDFGMRILGLNLSTIIPESVTIFKFVRFALRSQRLCGALQSPFPNPKSEIQNECPDS
jgi:hypothetical protein